MATGFKVIDGGEGIQEPDWAAIFDDELDRESVRDLWRLAVQELRRTEKLASVNAHQIKRMVTHQIIHDIAARHVIEQGAVTLTKKTKVPQYNPWFTVMQNMNSAITSAEAELTLSPRRRSNGAKAQKGKPQGLGAAAYLNQGKK